MEHVRGDALRRCPGADITRHEHAVYGDHLMPVSPGHDQQSVFGGHGGPSGNNRGRIGGRHAVCKAAALAAGTAGTTGATPSSVGVAAEAGAA
jgi:hypothetical protein